MEKINWNSVTNSRSVSIVGSFFFSQSIFLTQLSISTFIVVMIIAIILLIRKLASLAKLEIKSITAIYSLS